MARSLIDMGTLDAQLQESLAKVARLADFQITVWRHYPDASGCNWNAHLEHLANKGSIDGRWRDVVPQLRAMLNLMPLQHGHEVS